MIRFGSINYNVCIDRPRTGCPRTLGSITGIAIDLSLLKGVKTCSGDQPIFCPVDTGLLSSRLKRLGLKNYHTRPHLAGVRNARSSYTTATKRLQYVLLNVGTVVSYISFRLFLGVVKQFDGQAVRFISVSIEAVFRVMGKCFYGVKLLCFALSVSISKVLRRSLFIHTVVLILEIQQAVLKKSDTKLLQKKRIISNCRAPVAACDVVMSRQTKIMTPPYRGRWLSCERHRTLGPSLCFVQKDVSAPKHRLIIL
jgi:hypothetical protein